MTLHWQSIGSQLALHWHSNSTAWMSIDIPLVIDWHYIDTQLVSHWMSIGITLTVKYFNWQQIGIQLAMDWHRLYWIGIPYLPADTSQKVRPQTWRLAVRLSWVWLAPDWVLISGHWRIIPAFALHWLNWHEFQFRTFELHWRWIGIITNPLPILVGFDWLGCIGLEKSGALYIWEMFVWKMKPKLLKVKSISKEH